jgi:hypothetical protein
MTWSTPPTFAAGDKVGVAAKLQKLSDDLTVLGGALSTWSSGMTGITVGNGSQTSRCMQAGKLTMFSYQFTFGSTSAVTGALKITLPATAKFANQGFGNASAFDTSAGFYYPLFGTTIDANTVNIWTGPTTAGSRYVNIGTSTPFAWATGDVISVAGVYEAA